MRLDRWNAAAWGEVVARLEKDGGEIVLQAEGEAEGISYARTADLRYVGQGHEISVALPPLDFGVDAFVDELFGRFEANYAALFGRTVANSPVEAITWRLRASGPKGAPPKTATKSVIGPGPHPLKPHPPLHFPTPPR